MPAFNDTTREIANALRRHVDAATLEKIVNELLGRARQQELSGRD